jgi:predicted DNA-binding transcriptional regulator AlpA
MTIQDSNHASAVMTPPETSRYVGVAVATLAKMRCLGGGPVFIRLGRKVGYQRADLDTWLAVRRAVNTSDAAARLPPKLTIDA